MKEQTPERKIGFKEVFQDKKYDFLRTDEHLGENIILLALGGSHAYGTNVETSDIDLRGVVTNSAEEILLGNCFEHFVDPATDTTVYAFNKMIRLLIACNPATIEILGCKPEHYLYVGDAGKLLLENKKIFLSRRCCNTFMGYAAAQMRKLDNKTARKAGQAGTEKYVLRSIENARCEFKQHYFPTGEDSIKLYIDDAINPEYEKEIFMDISLKKYPLRDYAGMWDEMKTIASNYDRSSKKVTQFGSREKIGKHMMHLIRLYLMCIDILEKEEIITYRADEHDLLMKIRNCEFLDENDQPIPEFYEMVHEYDARFEHAKQNTSLPSSPNLKEIQELQIAVNEDVIRRKMEK